MYSVLPNPSLRQGFASLCPYRRQRLATYSVSIVTSISKSKQGAGCKFLNWNPPMLPQEMQSGGWLIVNFQPGAHLSPTSLVP